VHELLRILKHVFGLVWGYGIIYKTMVPSLYLVDRDATISL
jgi:hypothetical protein